MPQLRDRLIERGAASEADLERAAALSLRSGTGLMHNLVRMGAVEESLAAATVAEAHGITLLEAEAPRGEAVLAALNPAFLRRHHAVPIATGEDGLRVAMAEPSPELLAGLEFACEMPVDPVIATFSQIEERLGPTNGTDTPLPRQGRVSTDSADLDFDAPVIRLVQTLLANASLRRASDVHIEPTAQRLIVRYRIDGRLVEVENHPIAYAAPVASRIKVMASLDIAEARLPQDGRLRLNVRGREIDVRVSTSPTSFGESIVLRLLGRSELPLDLERLGLPDHALAKLVRALERPHGIVLLTGPTGSGKSTTLYAALARLRRPEVKILTVEDPVEVLLEGVNQVQVRPEIGLSYAHALRAFLRQDPDILMIGEIRDHETAEIALRAALTGHLVLSTLHTNSTTGAFTRLTDIGIEPYLAASTVNAVIAQRLIRTLCPACADTRPVRADEALLFEHAGLAVPARLPLPVGCPQCQATGYRGRIPLIEVLEIDAQLREAIREGDIDRKPNQTPANETLLGHGLALVAAARTSMAEVQRAVQSE